MKLNVAVIFGGKSTEHDISIISAHQTIENIDRIDKFTGLHSEQYLYGNAKRIFSKYATSAVCMFRIINIEEINEKISREIGNQVITEVSNVIKSKMASQYVFVRYMGPKFLIVFSGTEEDSLGDFLSMLKEEIESLKIVEEERQIQKIRLVKGKKVRYKELKEEKVASPKLNFVVFSCLIILFGTNCSFILLFCSLSFIIISSFNFSPSSSYKTL